MIRIAKSKCCPRCKKRKGIGLFQKRPDGRPQAFCKVCQREYDGERRAKKRAELLANPPGPRWIIPACVAWLCPDVIIPPGVARSVRTKFPDEELPACVPVL